MERRGYEELLNVDREKPPIPKLPKTIKELNALLEKRLTALWESKPVSEYGGEYHPGGIAVTDVELGCPFCGMKFKAVRKSGCFMHDLSPGTCPNCNFPTNVLNALMNLSKRGKRKK